MDIDKIVISKIFKLMETKQWSQRELAKQAKISYENFNRLMKGGRSITKSDVLPLIAGALGVTAEFLKSVEQTAETTSSGELSLIVAIQRGLPTLNESQLRTVLKLVDGYNATTTSAMNSEKVSR